VYKFPSHWFAGLSDTNYIGVCLRPPSRATVILWLALDDDPVSILHVVYVTTPAKSSDSHHKTPERVRHCVIANIPTLYMGRLTHRDAALYVTQTVQDVGFKIVCKARLNCCFFFSFPKHFAIAQEPCSCTPTAEQLLCATKFRSHPPSTHAKNFPMGGTATHHRL
jgi:hypothetical protein